MAIKAKGLPKPKLHPMDRTTYVLMIIFSLVAVCILGGLIGERGDKLCLAEENVVAYWYSGGWWMLPLAVYFPSGVMMYAALRLDKRVPLFYPLQYEGRYRRSEPPYNVRKQRIYSIAVIVAGLICFALSFLPDDARWVMDADGTVREYNRRSEVTSCKFTPERAKTVELRAMPGGKSSSPHIALKVSFTDGTERRLHSYDFIDADEAIGFMERFMDGLDENVLVSRLDRDNIKIVANYYNLSSSQTSRLYTLFEK